MPQAAVRQPWPPAGSAILSDRIGYKPILLFNLALTAVSMLLHGMAQSITQLALLRVLYGLAAGGILPAMNALVGRLVPPDSYGKAYGLTASMTCLGMAAGPFLGGITGILVGVPMAVRSRRRHDSPDRPAHPHRYPHASPLNRTSFNGFESKLIRNNS